MGTTSGERPEIDAARFEGLIAAARAGDPGARWEAVEACCDYLRSVARRNRWPRADRRPDVSDVVQNTIIEGWRSFAHFEGRTPGQLRAWLRIILLRTLSRAARRPAPARLGPGDRDEAFVGGVTPADDIVERRESSEALDSVLRRLPEHYRMAIRLRLWDDLPFAEIGARLGLSEDCARKLFTRAILRARGLMGPGLYP